VRKLPEAAFIRGIWFDVHACPDIKSKDDEACNGICCYDECEIQVDSTLQRQHQWQVLFHELCHGWLKQSPLNDDEYVIDTLAADIFTTLRMMGLFGK
jgi:hypothetical protein